MNNPSTGDPRAALLPYPRGCAGWRLWKMVHDVCGISRHEWCQRTERVNLLETTWWDPLAAAERGEALWRTWAGRRVVVLGAATRTALRLPPAPALLWSVSSGVTWCWVPHPSGRCREYNDPLARIAVGMRMEELVHGQICHCH